MPSHPASVANRSSNSCYSTNLSAHPFYPRLGKWEQSRIVELTHSFGADTVVWPTEQDFKLIVQHGEDTTGGYYYAIQPDGAA